MSRWKSKLDRLAAPPPPREPQPIVVDERADTRSLETLRSKIAAILAREPERPRPVEPSASQLPFVRIETPSGPLYRRVWRLPSSHRMGRFATGDALLADPPMLGLLGLDASLATVPAGDLLYLDTETTGLAGGTGTVPFLLGMARFEDGTLVLEQLLLRQLGEEAPILERLLEEVTRAKGLVTYNGKAFDLPLLRTRLVMNRKAELPERPHLDLVHVARRVHGKRVKPCTLVGVEAHVLGFERIGDVPGGEVVSRYRHFLRTGDDSALEGVVEHNAWDVFAMVAMVGLYGGPLANLRGDDLSQVARTVMRAGAADVAVDIADLAVAQGGGHDALRERAEILRARGERDRAVADLEALLSELDDPDARLALAKLYEHHRKQPGAALALVEQGTREPEAAAHKRRARLARKASKQQSLLDEQTPRPARKT